MRLLRIGLVPVPESALAACFMVCCGLFLGSRAPDSPASEKAPAASAPVVADLPRADPPFAGIAKRTFEGSKPVFPRPVDAPRGAQCAARPGRRCGIRQPLDLRRALPDADPVQTGLGRAPL